MTSFLSLRFLRLNTRMVLILGLIAILQTGILGHFAIRYLDNVLDEQIGQQAMRVALAISVSPDVVRAIEAKDTPILQPLSYKYAKSAKAKFVVFGDEDGIRLAHPSKARLGKPMHDDDNDMNEPALVEGKPYISKAHGSIGRSVRGKAPIFNQQGDIIGIVSVGYLLDTVDILVSNHRTSMLIAIAAAFAFSVFTAIWFAHHFKKAIFNLEPEEIGRMFQERNATLETVREGIVAINDEGMITTFNHAAIKTLQLPESDNYIGQHIQDVLPDSGLLSVLRKGDPEYDQEVWIHNQLLIVNRIPLIHGGKVSGVVSSFRLKNEVDLVSRKLTRIKQYAESLRSQSHEYNNKLHTIAGLIQINAIDEALAVIGQETSSHQAFIQQLMEVTNDSVLAGCLLGKYNRAKELGLKLQIDDASQMNDLPDSLPREQLVSIIGNLLDNALEATLSHHGREGTVSLSLSDYGKELIFEIEDQGRGLSDDEAERIFTRGYSTKAKEGRGIGLDLVKNLTEHLGGMITVDPLSPYGSRFTLYLPKNKNSLAANSAQGITTQAEEA
ncbi:sensor histidine kinase [Photobacterium sanctipauli]|uniref:histidine kinase n=1 Tax=Photobacterium sanctipauli TaxID=1342794 RepID=A0A2T3NU88_9GAMM|nr:sensor histidine kinase [Photobacterium sanctipauli]PSW19822.1 sensor histidine kinase [Photobacterium sanctipauli]